MGGGRGAAGVLPIITAGCARHDDGGTAAADMMMIPVAAVFAYSHQHEYITFTYGIIAEMYKTPPERTRYIMPYTF